MEDIILKSKILAIRDIEIALLKAKKDGMIIPDVVFETIQNLEDNYQKLNQE